MNRALDRWITLDVVEYLKEKAVDNLSKTIVRKF
jgi:hypothetical protein